MTTRAALSQPVAFEDFLKVDIRVGTILMAGGCTERSRVLAALAGGRRGDRGR